MIPSTVTVTKFVRAPRISKKLQLVLSELFHTCILSKTFENLKYYIRTLDSLSSTFF